MIMNKRAICTVLAITIGGVQISESMAQETPHMWPWRGVNLNSMETTKNDIMDVKEKLALNTIRLEFAPRFMAKHFKIDSSDAFARGLTWIDDMLDGCKETQLVCVVAVHEFPIDPKLGITQDSNLFWSNPQHLQEVVRLVGLMAKRFSRRSDEFGAYEILSEPLVRIANAGKVPGQWADLLKNLVLEIRKYDKDRWIVVTPGPGGQPSGYRNFEPIRYDKRIIYGAHMYLPHRFTHQGIGGMGRDSTYPGLIGNTFWNKAIIERSLGDLIGFQTNHAVPVWIGEFSAVRWAPGAEQYIRDVVAVFNKHGWGWAYFSRSGYHGWNPDYDAEFSMDIPYDWKRHYVGQSSVRWKTLKEILSNVTQ